MDVHPLLVPPEAMASPLHEPRDQNAIQDAFRPSRVPGRRLAGPGTPNLARLAGSAGQQRKRELHASDPRVRLAWRKRRPGNEPQPALQVPRRRPGYGEQSFVPRIVEGDVYGTENGRLAVDARGPATFNPAVT